jgi:hypothetical protein
MCAFAWLSEPCSRFFYSRRFTFLYNCTGRDFGLNAVSPRPPASAPHSTFPPGQHSVNIVPVRVAKIEFIQVA